MPKNSIKAAQKSLSEIAYEQIEEMIVTQTLAPGAMVSEAELGEILGCGRTPIREALLRLKLEGYIDVHARRGALVTPVDVLRQLELLEVRRPLEETVARLASRRATEVEREELKTLGAEIRDAAKDGDRQAFYEANKAIHRALENATHNRVLAKTAGEIHGHSRRFWYAHIGPDQLVAAARCHANVLKFIVKADPEGAAQAADELMDYLESLTRKAVEMRT